MAEEVILSLGEHCRRRVDRHLEQQLDEAQARSALAASEAIDRELYAHIERALELWEGGRGDAA